MWAEGWAGHQPPKLQRAAELSLCSPSGPCRKRPPLSGANVSAWCAPDTLSVWTVGCAGTGLLDSGRGAAGPALWRQRAVLFLPWRFGWPAVGLSFPGPGLWLDTAAHEAGAAEAGPGEDEGCWRGLYSSEPGISGRTPKGEGRAEPSLFSRRGRASTTALPRHPGTYLPVTLFGSHGLSVSPFVPVITSALPAFPFQWQQRPPLSQPHLAGLPGLWDLSSLTRDQTCALGSESVEF